MKAIVLAAGRGTRVRPLTSQTAKPMVPILGQPVLELLVAQLRRSGIDQVMVNTSYRARDIESYFGDGSRHGVEMAYSFEGYLADGEIVDQPVGSAGAIAKIQSESSFFDATFVVVCGDSVIDLDLQRLVEVHRQCGGLATIALAQVPREKVQHYGIVVRGDDGRVLEFQEKPAPEAARSTLANTGIYVFEPEVVEQIPKGVTYDIGGQLFPDLVARNLGLYGAQLPFQWLDIGRVSDYFEVCKLALQGGVHHVQVPGREVAPGIFLGLNARVDLARCDLVPPIHFGPGVVVGNGSRIVGPTEIGRGSVVESGACVERSILFEYTRVGPAATVKDAVVCAGYCVDPYGEALDLKRCDIEWIVGDSRALRRELTEAQFDLLRLLAGEDERRARAA